MQYSIVDGVKAEAFKTGRGVCLCCGRETVAKCGSKIIHHWAHKNLKHCDTWWENETEWHRTWKLKFPEKWREVIHFDHVTGEKHIADVKTDAGIVIELQNSPMSTTELMSRESFYKNIVWIVNAEKFGINFCLRDRLPSPSSDFAKKVVFRKGKWPHTIFFWRSEAIGESMVQIHDVSEIENQISLNYKGHHLFDWKRPRTVWYEATCPVFFDFGFQDVLFELLTYDSSTGESCVRKIPMISILKQWLNVTSQSKSQ